MSGDIVERTPDEMAEVTQTSKVLKLNDHTKGFDMGSALSKVLHCFDTAAIIQGVKAGVQYVVQVPTEYQLGLDAGVYSVMENAKTGKQWATLVRTLADGKKEIVCNLPIKPEKVLQGNPMHDISMNMQMMALQQQIASLTELVQDVCDTVRRIEQGQTDDRFGLLLAGKEGVEQAMLIQDTALQKSKLAAAQQTLLEARGQIAATFRTKVNEFPAVPKSPIGRFGLELARGGSLARRDEAFDAIQLYYQLYLTATRLLADSYLYCNEHAAAKKAYAEAEAFLGSLDFSRVLTLRYMHPDDDFSDTICERAVEYLDAERVSSFELARPSDYIEMTVSGEQILAAIGGVDHEEV